MSLSDHLSPTAARPLHLTPLAQVDLQQLPLAQVYPLLLLDEEDEPQATLIAPDGTLSRVAVPEGRGYFNSEELSALLNCGVVEYESFIFGPLDEHRIIFPHGGRTLPTQPQQQALPLNAVATAIWQASFAECTDSGGHLMSEFVIGGAALVMLDNELPY